MTLSGTMTAEARDAAARLPRLLRQVQQQVSGRLAGSLDAAGLSVEEWEVLSLVADSKGHTMTEVAEAAVLPAPSVTRLVDRLVASSLVYRKADPLDRRRVLVFMAARGRDLYRSLLPAQRRAWQQISASCGPDDTLQLATLLERALRSLA